MLSQAVDKKTKVVLQMTAEGRARFGEKVECVLTSECGEQDNETDR